MKACRVIKIIAFVIALLITAVAIAGNVLVIVDANNYKDQGVTVSAIIEELKTKDFKILPGKTAQAEEAATTQDETAAEVTAEPEATVAVTETAEPTVEPAATEAPAAETETKSGYDLDSRYYLLVTLMKAATARVEFGFLTKATVSGSQPFADKGFTVNTCLLITFALIFVCFILHCISKKCTKTFYGILLMILGYLIGIVFFCWGQCTANALHTVFASFDNYDENLIRIYTVAVFTVLAVFFGIPYYRCGSRQMRMNEMKHEIRKLKRKAARV